MEDPVWNATVPVEASTPEAMDSRALRALKREVDGLAERITKRYGPAIETMHASGVGGAEVLVYGAGALLLELDEALARVSDTIDGMLFAQGDEAVFEYWWYRLYLKTSDEEAQAEITAGITEPGERADALRLYRRGEALAVARQVN